jgi:hypothetical protein
VCTDVSRSVARERAHRNGGADAFTEYVDQDLDGTNVSNALEVEQVFAKNRIEVPSPPTPRVFNVTRVLRPDRNGRR